MTRHRKRPTGRAGFDPGSAALETDTLPPDHRIGGRFETPDMAQSGGCPQEALGTGRDNAEDRGLRLARRTDDLAWPITKKKKKKRKKKMEVGVPVLTSREEIPNQETSPSTPPPLPISGFGRCRSATGVSSWLNGSILVIAGGLQHRLPR